MNVTRRPLRAAFTAIEATTCLSCQWRSFSQTFRRCADAEKPVAAPTPPPSSLDDAPRAYGKSVDEFTPKPLSRPIGLPKPPRAGENSGIDSRTWRQKREDFLNYDKHLVKRKQMTQQMSTPYFREWSNMRHHKGKSFLAPPRLFKADKALFFPNLHGQTLVKSKKLSDTTPVLGGKISIVSVFSSAWAEKQAASFVSAKNNQKLHELVRTSGGLAQIVQINVEENALKAMLINLFLPSLRKAIGEKDWGKYFIVKRGLTNDMRDALGLLNSKVGYTYLLDGACRIRWAGSGIAEGDEREGLLRGAGKLLDDAKGRIKTLPGVEKEET